jgi:hypothetical protein
MKTGQLRNYANRLVGDRKLATVIGSILLLAMLGTLLLLVWNKWDTGSSTDYEGTIVDRWADYSESDQGSKPHFNLLVESQNGKRSSVRVDSNVYDSAKVGMRIKSSAGHIVLIDSQRTSTSTR